jgi:hypothetical protein
MPQRRETRAMDLRQDFERLQGGGEEIYEIHEELLR